MTETEFTVLDLSITVEDNATGAHYELYADEFESVSKHDVWGSMLHTTKTQFTFTLKEGARFETIPVQGYESPLDEDFEEESDEDE